MSTERTLTVYQPKQAAIRFTYTATAEGRRALLDELDRALGDANTAVARAVYDGVVKDLASFPSRSGVSPKPVGARPPVRLM